MSEIESKNKQVSFFEAFSNQQKSRGNTANEQAQKLVNLYRHAAAFGDNFPQQFNKMLSEASPEVLTALNDIIGGPPVRRYYDYLKGQNTTTENGSEMPDTDEQEVGGGYLPSPEDDLTVDWNRSCSPSLEINENTSSSQENFFKQLIHMHHLEIEKQNTFLKQALEQLQTGLQHQVEEQKKDTLPIKEALAEQQRKQIILLNRTLEKLIQSQTENLVHTLQKYNQNTQDMAIKQTNKILEVIQQEKKATSQYSDIIEDPQTSIQSEDRQT